MNATTSDWRETEKERVAREASLQATIDAQAALIATLQNSAPQIIPGAYTVGAVAKTIGGMSCAVLPTPSADTLGKYARVYDLFGSVVDLVKVAAFMKADGTMTYRWKPMSGAGLAQVVAGTANMTIKPLESPTDVVLTATLAGTMSVAIDKTLAFPGHTLRIRRAGGGLGALNVLVGVTNLLSVVLNASTLVGYDPFNDTYVQLG